MSRCQNNTVNGNQGNMSLLEPGCPSRAGSKYTNISEAQEKKIIKLTLWKLIEVHEEEKNQSLNPGKHNQTNNWK